MRLFKDDKSPYWQCAFYDHEGQLLRKSTRCSDKKAAEAKAREWERDAADPDSARKKATSLKDVMEALVLLRQEQAKAGRKSQATVTFYQQKAGQWLRVLEHAGDGRAPRQPFPLSRLSAAVIDAYISTRREDGVTESTIAKELVCLRAALKLAKRRGLWAGDIEAVMPVGFSPEYKPKERFLTHEELQKLLGSLSPDRAARVAFIVATSACWGETERARREDISAAEGRPSEVFLRGTKRELRRRTVPIVLEFQRSLLQHALKYAAGEKGALFCGWQNVRRDLHAACERVRISPCSPNDLRRTFATWMRGEEVSLELISPVMGHVDTRMMERVYGRLTPAMLATRIQAAARKVGQAEDSVNSPSKPVETMALGATGGRGEGVGHKSKNPASAKAETGFFEAPAVGLEPTTRGLTVLAYLWPNPSQDEHLAKYKRRTPSIVRHKEGSGE